MKLTKLQRFTAYCIMLAEYESDSPMGGYFFGKHCKSTSSGFCLMGDILFADYYFYHSLPELFAKGNFTHIEDYHFKSNKRRIEALKQCIIETHP